MKLGIPVLALFPQSIELKTADGREAFNPKDWFRAPPLR